MSNNNKSERTALIISVGGTIEPIVKSIEYYRPSFVVFFCSQKTNDKISEIKRELEGKNITINSECEIVEDPEDLLECYQKGLSALNRINKRKAEFSEILVDYTGGTKNMSVGLAFATGNKGVIYSYVGGEQRSKGGTGVVISGTEKVYRRTDPFDALKIEHQKMIMNFVDNYNYYQAYMATDELYKTINKIILKNYSLVFQGYYRWERYDYENAAECFRRADLRSLMNEEFFCRSFIEETSSLVEKRLKMLREIGDKPSYNLIIDIFANSERRADQGLYDFAIIELYRIIELAAQLRLKDKYNINTSDVKQEQIPERLQKEYITHYRGYKTGKIKIPLGKAYEILNELGDDLGKLYYAQKDKFEEIQLIRNDSILIHGFKPITEDRYDQIKELVSSLNLFKKEDVYQFPKFSNKK